MTAVREEALLQVRRGNVLKIISKITENTGLFKMIFGVLTTCHTQYT
jgi:hypothetical protein